MSELLDKRSNGKYHIKVFNKGALGSEKETIDQVKIGALELTRVNISPMNSVCAKTQVPTMPFLFRSVEHMGFLAYDQNQPFVLRITGHGGVYAGLKVKF